MPDIVQRLAIGCKPEDLYDAILDQGAKWWTRDTEIGPDETCFYFEHRTVVFRMRPERLESPSLIEWLCVGDHPEWGGTHLIFEISPGERRNECFLRMTHAGWESATDYFASCGHIWAHILDHLKEYAETKRDVPFFTA